MKSLLIYGVLILAFSVLVGAASSLQGTPDSKLSLSKTSVFDVPVPQVVAENMTEPGDVAVPPRAFTGAPPVISHGIADFLPILLNENQCVDCHLVDEKAEGEPTPIPESHFVDLRNAPGQVMDTVAGARYNCVSCHVPLTDAAPLVDNHFEP